MFRQASNRYQRSKGFKVKHAFQIALLVAVSIWLLYQVKHSHDKRKAYESSQANENANTKVQSSDESASGWNAAAFGRKGKFAASHDVPATPDAEKNEGNTEEEEEEKDLHHKPEENDNGDRGVGDDEIDRRDEEKTEEEDKQNDHEEKTEEENQNEHEEKTEEDENENGPEKVSENVFKDEERKEAEIDEREHGGDVGANFMQMKQDNEHVEEFQEINDEQHKKEKILEDEKLKEQSENEQENAPPLAPAGEKIETSSLESTGTSKIVLGQNKTATKSTDVKSSDSTTTGETDLKPNETMSVDTNKDVLTLDPNAEKQDEKLKEENNTVNATLVEEHETGTDRNGMAKLESQTKSLDVSATSESKNEIERTNKTNLEDSETVTSLDQSTAKSETDLSNKVDSKDVDLVTPLDQNVTKTEENSTSNLETSSEADDASEDKATSTSAERNSLTDSGQTDDGDRSQDIPVENEGSDRADLETLPQAEVDAQNSEELAVQ